eukprot:scaffold123028_cov21-Phaeocystis_antarctica.AAC.1
MTSSGPLASASASASGARRRLETGPAPTNEQASKQSSICGARRGVERRHAAPPDGARGSGPPSVSP